MAEDNKISGENVKVVLRGRLTVEQVLTAKKDVLAALWAAPEVTVHLEAVEEVDLSFLQMLCAARKFARERNQGIYILGRHQAAVETAVARYGFSDLLRCREACGACLWL